MLNTELGKAPLCFLGLWDGTCIWVLLADGDVEWVAKIDGEFVSVISFDLDMDLDSPGDIESDGVVVR